MEIPNLVERFFSFKPSQNNHHLENPQSALSTKDVPVTNIHPLTLSSVYRSHARDGDNDIVSPLTGISNSFPTQDPEISFQVASLSLKYSNLDTGARFTQRQHLQGYGNDPAGSHSQLSVMTRVNQEFDHLDLLAGQTQRLLFSLQEPMRTGIHKLPTAYENQHGQGPLPSHHDPSLGQATDIAPQDERNIERGDIRLTETQVRPYPCHYCGKRFKQKPHRKSHELVVHNKVKNHKCYICSTAFGTRSNLHRHINVKHGGNKDTKCRICKSVFAQVSHLESHARLVHKMKPQRVGLT